MLLGKIYGLDEQICEGLGKVAQDKRDLLPQFLRLELNWIFLEDGMSRLKDTVDDVEVSRGETGNHVGD